MSEFSNQEQSDQQLVSLQIITPDDANEILDAVSQRAALLAADFPGVLERYNSSSNAQKFARAAHDASSDRESGFKAFVVRDAIDDRFLGLTTSQQLGIRAGLSLLHLPTRPNLVAGWATENASKEQVRAAATALLAQASILSALQAGANTTIITLIRPQNYAAAKLAEDVGLQPAVSWLCAARNVGPNATRAAGVQDGVVQQRQVWRDMRPHRISDFLALQ